jgi:hypothetical protein
MKVTKEESNAAQPEPACYRYRFEDVIIDCDKHNQPILWTCYYNEKAGLLVGEAYRDEDGILVFGPWKVRVQKGGGGVEKFKKYMAGLPEMFLREFALEYRCTDSTSDAN